MTSSRLTYRVRPPRAPWDPRDPSRRPGRDPRRSARCSPIAVLDQRSERRRRVDGDARVRHRGGGRGRADRQSHGRRVVRRSWRRSGGGSSLAGTAFRSPVPTRGFRVASRGTIGSLEPALPVALRGVRILEAGYRDRTIGLLVRGRAAADQRARVPRGVVLAARPRGAGAATGSLGPRALGRGRHGDQADPVDRADGAGAGRRARALAARRARSGGPAARHADDRVLPGADRNDRAGRAGARDPARGSGRRAGAYAGAATMPSEGRGRARPSASRRRSTRPR